MTVWELYEIDSQWVTQTDTDSNLLLMLGLSPLSKSPRVQQGQMPPAMCLQTFVVGWYVRESLGWAEKNSWDSNRLRFGHVKGWICSGMVASVEHVRKQWAPALEPQNSVFDTPWVHPNLYTMGPDSWIICRVWAWQSGGQRFSKVPILHLLLYSLCCIEGSAWPKKYGVCGRCGEVTQHRDLGDCSFGSLPGASQSSLSSFAPSLLQAVFPSPESSVSGYELDFMCLPFKRVPGFLADCRLYLEEWFLQQMLCGILFLVLVLLAGEPDVRLRPHASGDFCNWDISPYS